MARRKRPTDISADELAEHKEKDAIANFATRGEKTAWQRQYENLEKLVRKLEPIEDKILSLTADKAKIIDELLILRKELVENCIHPFEVLEHHEGSVICKFCEKRMALPKHGETSETEDPVKNG